VDVLARVRTRAWVVVQRTTPMSVDSPATGGVTRRERSTFRRMTTPVPGPGSSGPVPRALAILLGAAAAVVVVAGVYAMA
jgi:hypothetical protein